MPVVGKGTRIQSGTPRTMPNPKRRANGLLLRGVVTNTYVIDSDGHPAEDYDDAHKPTAVYCDVLVLPSISGQRYFGIKKVLVAQDVQGLHRGRIWKPRPAKLDWLDGLDINGGSDPAYIDGDHVLVGFMNDSLDQPVILKSLPHPSLDLGREDFEIGTRMKLTEADKDPDLTRHHGVFWGVDDLGNWIQDSTFGNDGSLDDQGKEADPPTDGTKGNQTVNLPMDSKFTINLMDMSDPKNPAPKVTIEVAKGGETVDIKDPGGKWVLKVAEGTNTLTLEKADADAKLTLGDGAVHAAIFEHLQTWWDTQVKPKLDAFDAHQHLNTYIAPLIPAPGPPVPVTPVPPSPTITAPALDTAVKSTKVNIPDG